MSAGVILLIVLGVYFLFIPVMAGLFKALDAAEIMNLDGSEVGIWPIMVVILLVLLFGTLIWNGSSWIYKHGSRFFERIFKKMFGVK